MADNENDKILFFLGAGASIPSGLSGVIGLVDDFKRYLADSSLNKHLELTNTIIDILNQWKKETNYSNDIDIELLLETIERLEYSCRDTLPYFFENKNSKLKEIAGYDLITDGRKSLSEEVRKFVKVNSTLNAKSIDYLTPLATLSNHHRPLDIFTTNYDTNIERVCEKARKEYIDGFNPRWNPVLFKNENCDIRLFKLHGSISWYRTEQGDYERSSIRSTDMKVKLISGEDAVPIILYPGRKLHYVEPVLELLASLKAKLAEARYCILIGYSFKDDHLSKLFKYAARVNKDLTLILITPDAYQIYFNLLKRYSDTEFVHGFAHENFHPKDFNVDKPSALEGRVIYLPYTIQKILPLLKIEYLDKLPQAEKLADILSHAPARDLISEWKNCLKSYMECEYLEKIDNLLNRLAEQGLSWKDLVLTDWRYAFEIGLRGLLASVICGDQHHQKKWKAHLDEITHYFSFDNFIFIPTLGAKTVTFPPHIELCLNVYNSNVPSRDVANFMQNIVIQIINQKLSILENSHDKHPILVQLSSRIEEYIAYISIWQTSDMTFDSYFDLRKNTNQNQVNILKDAYKQFYHSETEKDQEAVRYIIYQMERNIFNQDIVSILDVFNSP